MLKTTPFHARTAPLSEGQNWRRWAGHVVASSYDLLHDREYAAIRNSAALIDVSPLFKYMIRGRDALRLLDRVLPRDMTKSKVGQVMYTPWCDPAGKVIDDGTVSRLSEDTFRLTSADPNLRWLFQNALGLSVTIEDVSDSMGAVSLQGPLSRDILMAAGIDVSGLKYFRVMPGTLEGIPVTVSRTGYTGDLGYEIWVEAPRAVELWDVLARVGELYGLVPSGILALDVARIEAGLLLLEVDYVSSHHALIDSQTSTPFELNLGWTVNLEKGPFVGKQALVEEKQRGPAWQFVGIEVEWESLERLYAEVKLPPKLPTMAWRVSVPVYVGGEQVGYASSGCWSPILKKYIAMAHLESSHTKLGSEVMMEVTVEHRRKQAAAKIVKTPFFDPERKRK
ncbi:MAG: aminomethyltransferase family protein [Gemmatimonadota bacterium]